MEPPISYFRIISYFHTELHISYWLSQLISAEKRLTFLSLLLSLLSLLLNRLIGHHQLLIVSM